MTAITACEGKSGPSPKSKVLKDLKEDINIIKSVNMDAAPLNRALTGKALIDFAKQLKADLDAGKVKKRDYANVKLKVTKVEKGELAQALFEFDDVSYYVSSQDNTKVISPPQKKHLKFKLHLKKEDGRWKIAVVSPVATSAPVQ